MQVKQSVKGSLLSKQSKHKLDIFLFDEQERQLSAVSIQDEHYELHAKSKIIRKYYLNLQQNSH